MLPRRRRPLTRERLARVAEYLSDRFWRMAGNPRMQCQRTLEASIWFQGLLLGHDRAMAEEEATILWGTRTGHLVQGTMTVPNPRPILKGEVW